MPRPKKAEDPRRKAALANLEKARRTRQAKLKDEKDKSIKKYLEDIESEVKAAEGMIPDIIEHKLDEVINSKYKLKDFTGYIAHDLFKAYVEAGGKKKLVEMMKRDPKQVLKVLEMIVNMSNKEKDDKKTGTGVVVNIQGLDPNASVNVGVIDVESN